LNNQQHALMEVWTMQKIYLFTQSIKTIQDLSKISVNVQTEYELDQKSKVATPDFLKLFVRRWKRR
jgi:hypothetical protein